MNNVFSNNLYRIPVDAAGKAGEPVDIWMDQPIKGQDGMRSANGKLIVAENGSGKISVITVNGDKVSVTLIMEGLNTPTGVEPAGNTIWISERGAGKVTRSRCRNNSPETDVSGFRPSKSSRDNPRFHSRATLQDVGRPENFSILCSPTIVTNIVDFSDMRTDNDKIIREHYILF